MSTGDRRVIEHHDVVGLVPPDGDEADIELHQRTATVLVNGHQSVANRRRTGRAERGGRRRGIAVPDPDDDHQTIAVCDRQRAQPLVGRGHRAVGQLQAGPPDVGRVVAQPMGPGELDDEVTDPSPGPDLDDEVTDLGLDDLVVTGLRRPRRHPHLPRDDVVAVVTDRHRPPRDRAPHHRAPGDPRRHGRREQRNLHQQPSRVSSLQADREPVLVGHLEAEPRPAVVQATFDGLSTEPP